MNSYTVASILAQIIFERSNQEDEVIVMSRSGLSSVKVEIKNKKADLIVSADEMEYRVVFEKDHKHYDALSCDDLLTFLNQTLEIIRGL